MKQFIATYATCEQTSPDDFKTVRVSKVFDYNHSINDVMAWLESRGFIDPDINDVTLSACDD